ncbi:DUF4214 domain-containing protein [uncultured Thiocystis sp.]|jgi:hypothetical protein|uniref:DUF4214 domain-containing protein n=1 Tax=uncultured Thiocystis sp. TaxID=1202134 RepID=UPI0025E92213|nr:DUF4214 domain-containing protein [uncultured Thiocystis sp.]
MLFSIRLLLILAIQALLAPLLTAVAAPAERADTLWQVAEIYLATMDYAPDQEGLQYWSQEIETKPEWTPTTVAQSFFDQPLVQDRYPDSQVFGSFIESLYQNIFRRSPDSTGYAYWLGELESGRILRNQMIIALINGGWANFDAAEDMARFENRLRVSLAFADYQTAYGINYSTLGTVDQSYLRQAGSEVLKGVTDSAATRSTAIARIPGLLESLAQQSVNGVLILDPIAADGSVQGHYRPAPGSGETMTGFSVSPSGKASFWPEDDPNASVLTAEVTSGLALSLDYAGVFFDGNGELTNEERSLLQAMFDGSMGDSLALIPLNVACKSAAMIDDKQLAALLAPWQLALKYFYADRTTQVLAATQLANCDFFGDGTSGKPNASASSHLIMSASCPFPVVFGYFPFDEIGAAESGAVESSRLDSAETYGSNTPLLPGSSPEASGQISTLAALTANILDQALIDNFGPCNAKCRGACGADCPMSNCGPPEDFWDCLLDEEGNNTGYKQRYDVYRCGTHPACITHDACYDYENAFWGCGSWMSAIRRHHVDWLTPDAPSATRSCDAKVVVTYGPDQASAWGFGLGPYTDERLFAYSDDYHNSDGKLGIFDPNLCLLPNALLTVSAQPLSTLTPNAYSLRVDATRIVSPVLPDPVRLVDARWNFGDSQSDSQGSEDNISVTNGTATLTLVRHYPLDVIEHRYPFSVELQLDGDIIGQAERDIVIPGSAVSVSIQAPRIVTVELQGGATQYDHEFEAVATPPGSYRFDWNFGDGSTTSDNGISSETQTSSSVSHAYMGLVGGEHFNPSVKLYDSIGSMLGEDSISITIEDPCGGVGTFTCANGTRICANIVCNQRDDCGDGSDEVTTICGIPNACCVATNGCPGETATSCSETCCCCPWGQVCDPSNPANGCISTGSVMAVGEMTSSQAIRKILNQPKTP